MSVNSISHEGESEDRRSLHAYAETPRSVFDPVVRSANHAMALQTRLIFDALIRERDERLPRRAIRSKGP